MKRLPSFAGLIRCDVEFKEIAILVALVVLFATICGASSSSRFEAYHLPMISMRRAAGTISCRFAVLANLSRKLFKTGLVGR
jgi:hypothetical protein